jgi:polyhydroxyalkanoate synthesis regulator phasin
MTRFQKIAAGVVAVVAVSGAGAAVAATKLGSPEEESRAVVNDAARELGVSPERLTNALKTGLKNRIDEAVEAGRMTKAEGDRLKARIDEGGLPFLAPVGRRGPHGPGGGMHRDFRFHHFRKLETAAKYLGMTETALHNALRDGKTLAQVARDRNKSVDGLVDALVTESRKRIDQAVEDGRLTRAEADEFVAGLRERITDRVNGRFPRLRGHFRRFGGGGSAHLGPPPLAPTF